MGSQNVSIHPRMPLKNEKRKSLLHYVVAISKQKAKVFIKERSIRLQEATFPLLRHDSISWLHIRVCTTSTYIHLYKRHDYVIFGE